VPLEERLELDIDEALRGIDSIEEALSGSASSFKVALADALDVLGSVAIGEVDASSVTTGIDAAVAAADTDAVVDADATAVTSAIDSAVDDADSEVTVEAEVGSITSEIEGAVADADTTVEIEADTGPAVSALSDLGEAGVGAADGVDAAGIATENLGNLSAASTGSVIGLESALDEMGTTGKVVSGVIAAVATSAGVLISAALEADTADRRFAASLGEVAHSVNAINVEGIADDFATLAQQTGNSDEAMKLAVARLADLGASAGASGDAVATAAEDISLLAIRASVMNPTLGDAGDVADRMTNAFARGGRALAPFGLALTAAEINARAMADTGKAAADELTIFDKAAAGAALATEQLGDSLRTDIVEGAKGTEITLRTLRQEFGDTLEVFGQPLLGPAIEGMQAGQPILLGFAEVFGELAQVAIPLATEALTAFSPVMGTTTQLLTVALQLLGPVVALIDAIPDPLLQAAAAMALFNRLGGVSGLVGVLGSIGGAAGGAAGGLRSLPALIGAINPATAAVTLGVGLLAVAWQKHAKEQAESNARVREGAEAFQDEAKAIGDTIEAIAEKRIPENQLDDIRRMGLTYKEAGDLAADSVGGFDTFIDRAEEAGEITSSVADALRANGGNLRDLKLNFEALGVSQGDMNDSNLALIETFQSLSGETQESAKSALEHLSATGNLTDAQQELVDAVLASTSGNVNYVDVLGKVKGTSEEAEGGTEGLTGALDEQEQAAADAEAALSSLMDAALGYIDSQIGADNATRAFADSLVDVKEKQDAHTEAIRQHGASSTEAAAAQREMEDAIRGARDQAIDAAKAQVQLAVDQAAAAGGTIEASEKMGIYRASLVDAANQASGPTRQAILDVIATLDALPPGKDIPITANTAQAQREIAELNAALERLGIGASLNIALARAGGLMAGGSMQEGWTWVGEAGPELAYKRGGQVEVFSAERSREMEPSGGGRPIEVNVYEVAGDPRATAFAVGALLGEAATR
jgi:hypothetical protein